MNAIKGAVGGHNQANHTGHHGGTYRLGHAPPDKIGKLTKSGVPLLTYLMFIHALDALELVHSEYQHLN